MLRYINIACLVILSASNSYSAERFEEAPILYWSAEEHNPVVSLNRALAQGAIEFSHDPQTGYLKSLMDALNIPEESQLLVFSKTSFQNQRITPATPCAIYFNDDSYIGTVQRGDVIEVSTTDPQLGTVFYTLYQRKSEPVEFIRQTNNCLQCHASTLTRGIPGHVVRSVYPDENDYPILKAGTHLSEQTSPFAVRWGGWCVTGTHGDARHMGNGIARELDRDAELDTADGANRLAVDARVDTSRHLTARNDIIAHMVLLHQAKMHNLLTQANFETRLTLKDQAVMDEILERDSNLRSESTKRRIANAGNKLVDYMLFVGEANLNSLVVGTSDYASVFEAMGPSDASGRSLREFDLESRLFRYPLSYLLYSEQFDALPPDMLEFVYRRLWKVLSGEETDAKCAHLDSATRKAFVQIVRETKSGFPSYWK